MKLAARLTCCLFFLFSLTPGFSQDLTGIWRGYFYTEGGDQYKYELQVDHKKKNTLSGVSYSYLDTRFYGKATLVGKFTRANNETVVQETKTVELKMAGGSVACIMKCVMTYSRSGREEFLEGVFSSVYETANLYAGTKRGDNCGGGKVYLRKVPTSDFTPEPFLQKRSAQQPPKQQQPAAPATVKKNTVTTPPAKKKPPVKTPATSTTTVAKPRTKLDTIKNQTTSISINNIPGEKRTNVPLVTRERKNELTKTLVLQNKEVEVRLYDNGQVDNDTISVYLDGKLILANQRLSEKAIVYKLKVDENEPEHTLVMVAENMGSIPPNTSLMIVQDGDKRYQVSITSTEQKNAMVRFRYQKAD